MKKVKSKVDVGRGFKRIYFITAGLWVALVFALFLGDFMACKVHTDTSWQFSQCIDYNAGNQILQLFLFGGVVIPIYYFLKWIGAGFKK